MPRSRLAAYKLPKSLLRADAVQRGANGKPGLPVGQAIPPSNPWASIDFFRHSGNIEP